MAETKDKAAAAPAKSPRELRKELDALTAKYHEKSRDMKVRDAEALSAEIKHKRDALAAALAKGAKACDCGEKPIVIRRNRGVWEAGCLTCPPYVEKREIDGKKRNVRVSVSAQGEDAEEAVENWNRGERIYDFFLDRGTGYTMTKEESDAAAAAQVQKT